MVSNGRSFSRGKFKLSRTTRGDIASQQCLFDTTALLLAKLLENTTGSKEQLQATMAELLPDPERLGAVTLSLTSFVSQLANHQTNPESLQALCDWLIQTCGVPPPEVA